MDQFRVVVATVSIPVWPPPDSPPLSHLGDGTVRRCRSDSARLVVIFPEDLAEHGEPDPTGERVCLRLTLKRAK